MPFFSLLLISLPNTSCRTEEWIPTATYLPAVPLCMLSLFVSMSAYSFTMAITQFYLSPEKNHHVSNLDRVGRMSSSRGL
ncbi:hypothetical protein F4778DRAFT_722026 [Xylariomycetidae sp. FL2044]|nr:hypothetical protein F4778DRAFT_722026 [Xylariomycetidae sp. FL2044]